MQARDKTPKFLEFMRENHFISGELPNPRDRRQSTATLYPKLTDRGYEFETAEGKEIGLTVIWRPG